MYAYRLGCISTQNGSETLLQSQSQCIGAKQREKHRRGGRQGYDMVVSKALPEIIPHRPQLNKCKRSSHSREIEIDFLYVR